MLIIQLITDLNHSDLVCHKAISDNEIAGWYVQAFLGYCGSNQQVDLTLAKFFQHILLLCLIKTDL